MAAVSKGATAPADPALDPRYDELEGRVARLEEALGAVLTGKAAEISQEERDRQTLSRRPNSYPEAVEYEAARKRQEERDRARDGAPEPEPAEA